MAMYWVHPRKLNRLGLVYSNEMHCMQLIKHISRWDDHIKKNANQERTVGTKDLKLLQRVLPQFGWWLMSQM